MVCGARAMRADRRYKLRCREERAARQLHYNIRA